MSEAREVVAKSIAAHRYIVRSPGCSCGECAEHYHDDHIAAQILADLDAAGFRVERLEAVGWQVKMPHGHHLGLVQSTGTMAYEWRRAVFAIVPPAPLPSPEAP